MRYDAFELPMSLSTAQCNDIASLLGKMKNPTSIQFFSSEFADRIIIYGEFDNRHQNFKSYMWHPEMECFMEQFPINIQDKIA